MLYDRTGQTYSRTRQPDPRIAEQIWRQLSDMRSVANIGAGAGSYEPPHTVVAVEPSHVMIAQRPRDAVLAVRAVAEALPIRSKSVDAALAVLTVHHWDRLEQGLAELVRITRRRIVLLTWDHQVMREFWLLRDYLPAAATTDAELAVPLDHFDRLLPGVVTIHPVAVPADCTDGFGAAFWQRPHAYLASEVQAGMSLMTLTPRTLVHAGLERLRADLQTGAWQVRNGDLLDRREFDAGYRLVVADVD
ncbi:class I SAM-dependent methyltransferase [Nocardia sp. CNY236]|uniref:class I SAM-dependent methyltransferase n=1 Tax=Nocardia sp. CNY236 TaxID=1169152 RepID=UPI0003FAECD5|nr:class I SAM-dependent methyltransferase [Nocardia sp. CNY236]